MRHERIMWTSRNVILRCSHFGWPIRKLYDKWCFVHLGARHKLVMSCCGNKRKMPPIKEQVSNIAEASKKAFKELVKSGRLFTSNEVQAARIVICRACEQFSFGRCAKCGCWTSAKSRFVTEDCPSGLWPSLQTLSDGRVETDGDVN